MGRPRIYFQYLTFKLVAFVFGVPKMKQRPSIPENVVIALAGLIVS